MMAGDHDRAHLLTRRAVILGAAQLGLFTLLSGRLYQLQILQGAEYKTLAEDNRINIRLIAPRRGLFLDRVGKELAMSQQNFRLIAVPAEARNFEALIESLGQYVALSDNDRRRIQRDRQKQSPMQPIMIAENITWDQVAAIEVHNLELQGAMIDVGEVRAYPYGVATAHLLGYVGSVTDADLKAERNAMLRIPGFRIGKGGLEKQHDLFLRGVAGSQNLEVNAHGTVVRELARSEPVPGHHVRLTVDIGLQEFTQNRLQKEQSAAAVVMDVHKGSLYALCSHPTFDPNLFTYGILSKDWDALSKDERAPLTNKVTSGLYAPGSTFKMMTALAALESGDITEKTVVFCPGHYDLGKHRFHCWKHAGHGNVNLESALAESCDTYFYDISKKVGIDKIAAMARRFGFGSKLGVDYPFERGGIMPDRAWKLTKRGKGWQQGETLIASIGQGYVLATPLQLAVMTARLVNGGKAVLPHVTEKIEGEYTEITSYPSLGIAPKFLTLIERGMNAAVNNEDGTAYGSRIKEKNNIMGGKTGTSQVRRISVAERAEGITPNEERPWRERDHALFVGYAPRDNPRYAVAVVVEHGGGGAKVAAPIARDILAECQIRKIGEEV
jgi:penicillin-binding protein 2